MLVCTVVLGPTICRLECQGMTLEYKVKDKGEEKKEVRVQFDPPLAGYEEVKPRLLAMTADAQESLGMVRVLFATLFSSLSTTFNRLDQIPANNHFRDRLRRFQGRCLTRPVHLLFPRPSLLWPTVGSRTVALFDVRWIHSIQGYLDRGDQHTCAGGAIRAATLCETSNGIRCRCEWFENFRFMHGLDAFFSLKFKYVLSTFLFGFTVLVPLRRRIQKARIDSIMKGN